MNIFSFNQVDLFPFSCVQDQVKPGEDSLVTHDSGSPVCPSVMGIVWFLERSCILSKVRDTRTASPWHGEVLEASPNHTMPCSWFSCQACSGSVSWLKDDHAFLLGILATGSWKGLLSLFSVPLWHWWYTKGSGRETATVFFKIQVSPHVFCLSPLVLRVPYPGNAVNTSCGF